jgi:hypothetical protein
MVMLCPLRLPVNKGFQNKIEFNYIYSLGDFADTFIQSDLQPFIHKPPAESTTQGSASSEGAGVSKWHLDTR